MKFPASLDYREMLKREFEQRAGKNPHYSLRAFARDLKLAPSHLSGILSGQYGLSKNRAAEIASRIGYSAQELEEFVTSVESQHARSSAARSIAHRKLRTLRPRRASRSVLDLDALALISNPHHFSILELTYLKSFRPDPSWIAHALGISQSAANLAIDRLKRLGLLEAQGERWQVREDCTETVTDIPSSAIQALHAQVLKMADSALPVQPVARREYRSTFFSIRKEKIEEAKRAIEEFHRDFCEDISEVHPDAHDKDQVYCLATQLFSLTPALEEMK